MCVRRHQANEDNEDRNGGKIMAPTPTETSDLVKRHSGEKGKEEKLKELLLGKMSFSGIKQNCLFKEEDPGDLTIFPTFTYNPSPV